MKTNIILTATFSALVFAIIYFYTSIPTVYIKDGACQYWQDAKGKHDCSRLPYYYEIIRKR